MGALAFGVLAACALLSALAVVRSQDLVHAVLWLGVALFVTAALYAMLGASFLAAVQVLLYVGGVVTLMIFGVMMTRRHHGVAPKLEDAGSGRAAAVALALFGSFAWAVRTTEGIDAPAPAPAATATDLGHALLTQHLLAFETISILLLAAMVGAIVLARRRDGRAAVKPVVRPVPAPLARTEPEAAE
jgi:NADH-quinone oxidoreductase subunit J